MKRLVCKLFGHIWIKTSSFLRASQRSYTLPKIALLALLALYGASFLDRHLAVASTFGKDLLHDFVVPTNDFPCCGALAAAILPVTTAMPTSTYYLGIFVQDRANCAVGTEVWIDDNTTSTLNGDPGIGASFSNQWVVIQLDNFSAPVGNFTLQLSCNDQSRRIHIGADSLTPQTNTGMLQFVNKQISYVFSDQKHEAFGGLIGNFVSLVTPADGGTINADFINFVFNFNSGTSSNPFVRINYGTSTAFGLMSTEFVLTESGFRRGVITRTNALATGTIYYAQASLIDYPSTGIATSALIQFTTFGSSTAPDTSAISGGIFGFLAKISRKPPFGYLVLLKNAFNGINSSTTDRLFSASTSLALAASPIFALRTGISWILWLLFAVWFIVRLKHVDL